MRVPLALALLSSIALGQGRVPDRACAIASRRTSRGGIACSTAALFEFAPASGSGMGTACACVTPSGARGEVLTFSRASAGFCTKANETTGIANGDLVECASGQPRVMPGGNGLGGLGLGVWEARTNVALRSAEFDNVAWANFIAGAGTNPSKGGADTDVAPDGTTTAERITFNATGAADSSGISQTVLTAVAYSGQVYLRGNATTASGSIDLCLDNAATATCTTCSYVLGSWTRCCLANVTSKASGLFYIGNLSSLNGGTTRAAQTPTLWMGDAEAGTTCSPPIRTTGTSATRLAELADFAVAFGAGTTRFSMAGSYIAAQLANGSGAPMGVIGNGTPGVDTLSTVYLYPFSSGGGSFLANDFNGVVAPSNYANIVSLQAPGATQHRAAAYFDGTVQNACMDGSCGAGQAGAYTPPTFTRWRIGAATSTSGVIDGVSKLLCLDPSATRCR